jgi:hypothetical protein
MSARVCLVPKPTCSGQSSNSASRKLFDSPKVLTQAGWARGSMLSLQFQGQIAGASLRKPYEMGFT